MNKIIFNAANHTYSKEGNYTSVSKLISRYKNEFDRNHWSSYKALERLIPNFKEFKAGKNINSPEFIEYGIAHIGNEQLFDDMKKIILKEWDIENQVSVNKGNVYHLKKEQQSYTNGVETNPFDGKIYPVIPKKEVADQKVAIVDNLYDLEDGYYPELILWNDEYKIAGQADKVFIETKKNKRYIDIDDYKTNKKISKTGYMGNKMKAPLSHLPDANYIHYSLQISTYAWLLEEFGYRVRNLSFHHYNKQYPINYMSKEVKLMLDGSK